VFALQTRKVGIDFAIQARTLKHKRARARALTHTRRVAFPRSNAGTRPRTYKRGVQGAKPGPIEQPMMPTCVCTFVLVRACLRVYARAQVGRLAQPISRQAGKLHNGQPRVRPLTVPGTCELGRSRMSETIRSMLKTGPFLLW
jgi:hypothetical protein